MKKQYTLIMLIMSIIYNAFGQSFEEHHVITTGSIPGNTSSIEVADFNNDGSQDIIACSSWGEKIYFLENKGNNEFEVLQELDIGFSELREVRSGDIDNDGLIDIVYSRYSYSYQLSWLRNIGGNKFEKAGIISTSSSTGWHAGSFSMHDLNGDNYDDVVIGNNYITHELKVKINTGQGTFGLNISLIDEGELSSYQCIDFDNDDDIDIVYNTEHPYRLVASINNGNGEFSEEVIIDTNLQNPVHGFHCFDSDGDSDIDILGFTENDSIALFINNGENAFTRIIMPNDSLFSPYCVNSLDFDNDGDYDLINDYFEIFENIGNNTFHYKKDNDFPFYTLDYKVTDLNNNGDEDIVYAYYSGSIGYIEDASFENLKNGRILTSQVLRPKYPAYEKINDDEFPDICVLDDHFKYVFYLNNGMGEFTDTIIMDRLHVYSTESAFFDINNDGYCDIVSFSDHDYPSFSDSSSFKLARNNGDNTFTNIFIDDFNYLANHHSYFNDYNNDSILNAILTEDYSTSGTDTILIFNIDQDFLVSIYDSIVLNYPIEINDLKFYDFDNNGQKDILICNGQSLFIGYSVNSVFTNHFDTIISSSEWIYDFVPANVTDDTISDILLLTANYIQVLENFNGTSFEQIYNICTNNFPKALYAEDLNNDSIDEAFCISNDTINLLQFDENNNYAIEKYYYSNYAYYSENRSFIFPDIDLDGDPDLLCTYHYESDISWFENSYIDAHYTSFPENGAVWTEHNEGNPPQTWTSLYVTESDTFLLNNSYTNIYEYYLDPTTFDTIRQLYASIRQDIPEKKVFVIRHYLSENNERLLLDFKAVVGDTVLLDAYYWDLNPQGTDSVFVLDSITEITLYNDEVRDVMYLSNHKAPMTVTHTLIEGVGSIYNPFGPAMDMVNKKQLGERGFCCPDYLLCLTIDDEHVYVLNDESICKELKVWSSVQSYDQNAIFEIYPNPAKDRLNIKLKEKLSSNCEIILYNNLGKEVSHFHIEENLGQHTLDIKGFKPGIYYLVLKYENRRHSSKFIIMK